MGNLALNQKKTPNKRPVPGILNKISEALKSFAAVYELAGRVAESLGKEDLAIKLYAKSTRIKPENGYLHFKTGQLQYKNGLIKEAAKSFRKASNLNDEPSSVFWMSNASTSAKPSSAAIAKFRLELISRPKPAKTLVTKGREYYNQGLIKEAMSCLKQALEFESEDVDALLFYGLCLCSEKKYGEALTYFSKGVRILPTHPAYYVNMGLCHSNLGNHDKALECYNKAENLGLINVELLNNKGFSLVETNMFNQALLCYELALELNPDDLTLLSNKGTCLCKAGRHEEAIDFFDKALKINSEDIMLLNNKALCLEAVGRSIEALEIYNKALEIDSQSASVYINKGGCLSKLNRFHEALNCYNKAIKCDPNNREIWSFKAAAYEKIGENDQAIHCYNKALGLVE